MPTYTSNSNNGYVMKIDLSSQQFASTNSSIVTYKLYLSTSSYKNFSGAYVYSGYLNIAGSQKWNIAGSHINFGNTGLSQSYTKTLVSGKVTIKHDSNGSKQIQISAGFSAPSGGYGPSDLNINQYWTLPKINTTPVKPTPKNPIKINKITWADDNTTAANKFGFMIQNISKPHFYVSATPSTGSSIQQTKVYFEGSSWVGHDVHTNKLINGSGNIKVGATAKDSNGQSANYETTMPVEKYSYPKLKEFSVSRTDYKGNVDTKGEYAKVSYAYNVSHLKEKNTVSAEIQWNGKTKKVSNQAYDVRGSDIIQIGSNAVTIKMTVKDYFGQHTRQYDVNPGFITMDFGLDGNRVAIGAEAVDEGLTIAMKTNFLQSIRKKGNPLAQFLHMDNLAADTDLGHTLSNAIYSISGTYKGAPSTSNYYGILINIARYNTEMGITVNNLNYCFQIIINANGRIWVRSRWNGAYNNWKEVGA